MYQLQAKNSAKLIFVLLEINPCFLSSSLVPKWHCKKLRIKITKNIVYCKFAVKYESSSAMGQPDDLSRPLCWLSVSVSRDWWAPPPTHIEATSSLFRLAFYHLALRTWNAVTWTCDWLEWFTLLIIITNINNSLLQHHLEKDWVALSLTL